MVSVRAFVCAVVVAAAGPAGAVTALLPIEATGELSPSCQPKAILAALGQVLKADLRPVVAAENRCSQQQTCLARAAGDADEVAFIAVAAAGDAACRVSLSLFAPDGTAMAALSTTLQRDSAEADLRALVVTAFAPAEFIGHASLQGVQIGDEVLVDGLRVDGTDLTLRPGHHLVRVVRGDAFVDVSFDVPFRGSVVVDVPAAATAPTATTATAPPLALAHGLFTVAALGGLTWMIVDELAASAAVANVAGVCLPGKEDPTGANFNNRGINSTGICAASQIENRQWLQMNREMYTALGLGFAGIAIAGATAGVASAFFLPSSE